MNIISVVIEHYYLCTWAFVIFNGYSENLLEVQGDWITPRLWEESV